MSTKQNEQERIAILMQLLGMQDVQTPYPLLGQPEMEKAGHIGVTDPMQTQETEYTPPQQGMPSVDVDNEAPTGGGTKPSGGSGWTDAATLALANSMPELIKAAYQRPDRLQGRSVGGGKPSFQMSDPFGKRDKFRSLMAQYLR